MPGRPAEFGIARARPSPRPRSPPRKQTRASEGRARRAPSEQFAKPDERNGADREYRRQRNRQGRRHRRGEEPQALVVPGRAASSRSGTEAPGSAGNRSHKVWLRPRIVTAARKPRKRQPPRTSQPFRGRESIAPASKRRGCSPMRSPRESAAARTRRIRADALPPTGSPESRAGTPGGSPEAVRARSSCDRASWRQASSRRTRAGNSATPESAQYDGEDQKARDPASPYALQVASIIRHRGRILHRFHASRAPGGPSVQTSHL